MFTPTASQPASNSKRATQRTSLSWSAPTRDDLSFLGVHKETPQLKGTWILRDLLTPNIACVTSLTMLENKLSFRQDL